MMTSAYRLLSAHSLRNLYGVVRPPLSLSHSSSISLSSSATNSTSSLSYCFSLLLFFARPPPLSPVSFASFSFLLSASIVCFISFDGQILAFLPLSRAIAYHYVVVRKVAGSLGWLFCLQLGFLFKNTCRSMI